jgi:hypothetical protein
MQELQGALPEHVMPPALVSDAAQPLLHSLLDTNMRACFHRCPDERRHCVAAQHSMSYEEEDNACHMRLRLFAFIASGRSRTLTALSVRCVCCEEEDIVFWYFLPFPHPHRPQRALCVLSV